MRGCLLVLAGWVLLGGCVTSWEKPRVSLAEVRLAGGNLLQQRLKLSLRVSNPNGVEIRVEQVSFELLVAERKFASGRSAAAVSIPARGEGVLEVDAQALLMGLVGRLPELVGSDGRLHYRLKGEAQIAGYGLVPFDQPGSLDVRALQGRRPVPEEKPDEGIRL